MIRLPILLSVLGACTGSAVASGTDPAMPPVSAKPVYGALTAGQLKQIQAVGRAVLAAKSGQQASAEEEALRSDLHALAASVDDALQLKTPKLSMSVATDTHADLAVAGVSRANQARIDDLITPQLTRLHERRAAIEQLATDDEASKAQITHVQRLAQTAGHLEQSVLEALALPDDAERYARLAELRQRLRPCSPEEWRNDREREAIDSGEAKGFSAPTPTLVTQTQHQRGLDELRSGKH